MTSSIEFLRRTAVYQGIEASLSLEAKGLDMEGQCQLAEVSRSGFYRYLQQEKPKEEDLLLQERLQQLAVAHDRKCGYRRLTGLLRREGYLANKKRVLWLMQEGNLLSRRRAKYVLTTDSQHDLFGLSQSDASLEPARLEPAMDRRYHVFSVAQ